MTFNKKEWHKQYYLKNKEHKIKEYRLKKREYIKEWQKEYRLKNKEQIKEYNLKNKERITLVYKKWYLKNKEHKKEYHFKNKEHRNQLRRKKRKTNPAYKLTCNLRSRIWKALKGISKSASTMELIGCTIDELRSHLESKFKPWMTWENYGLWDVDHRVACAKFDLTDSNQQRKCFHWTNLQPMEHTENMKKGAR